MKNPLILIAVGLSLAGCAQAQDTNPVDAVQNPRPDPSERALIAQPVPENAELDARAVRRVMAQPNAVVLDVRTPEEYATGHLDRAQNVNFRAPDFAEQVAGLDKSKQYVVYCASGNRSRQAAAKMREQGFKKVVDGGAYKDLKEVKK